MKYLLLGVGGFVIYYLLTRPASAPNTVTGGPPAGQLFPGAPVQNSFVASPNANPLFVY